MTAVEWLTDKFYANEGIMKSEWLEQAKEMEKEQIMKANEEGFYSGQSMAHNGYCSFESSKDYYNETFKSESNGNKKRN